MVYEHQVVVVERSCVTYVNGIWQGMNPPGSRDLSGCPSEWEFLDQQASLGWTLDFVTAVESAKHLYLRKFETSSSIEVPLDLG